jgi:hypothetical protein
MAGFNQERNQEGVAESRGIAPLLLFSSLRGGKWCASSTGRFTLGGTIPGTHCIAHWVDPRNVLYFKEKNKIYFTSQESNPDSPVAQH